jgi:hypothetical protein
VKIELYYFEGCPNYKPCLGELGAALSELGISDPVRTTRVGSSQDAVIKRFQGSPSIRIDKQDLFQEPEGHYGMKCRIYLIDGEEKGYPDRETIKQKLRAFQGST